MKSADIGEKTKSEAKTKIEKLDTKRVMDHSIDHSFTRSSVKRERQLLSEGYLFAIDNETVSIDAIDKELAKNEEVFTIKSGNDVLCTTALVLKEERVLLCTSLKLMTTLWA